MTQYLTMIKDQAQGVGQNANHGQHDQRTALMDGGVLEMGLGSEGLKHFGIHPPAASSEFVEEAGRDRTQIQVASVIVRAF